MWDADMALVPAEPVLIDTWWNVNISAHPVACPH